MIANSTTLDEPSAKVAEARWRSEENSTQNPKCGPPGPPKRLINERIAPSIGIELRTPYVQGNVERKSI